MTLLKKKNVIYKSTYSNQILVYEVHTYQLIHTYSLTLPENHKITHDLTSKQVGNR